MIFRSVVGIDSTDYLIVSPRVYHPGTTAKLSVDLFGNKSCYVEVSLLRTFGLVSTGNRKFAPGEHGELELKVIKYIVNMFKKFISDQRLDKHIK